MANHEKIGSPRFEDPEGGVNVELGQPVWGEGLERESIEASLPAVKEALHEFYSMRAAREEEAAFAIGVIRDRESIYKSAAKGVSKENLDFTLALTVLESARGEFQYRRMLIESQDESVEHGIQDKREGLMEKEAHYQEASDVLFSADEQYSGVPDRGDLIQWLAERKQFIKEQAKDEEEKYKGREPGEGNGLIWRPRLLTDVPAIERFEKNQETTRDFNEIMNLLESYTLSMRDYMGGLVMEYANDPSERFKDAMAKNLRDIRKLELFLSQLEGERNERIAKKI